MQIGPNRPTWTKCAGKERREGRPYILPQGAFHPLNFHLRILREIKTWISFQPSQFPFLVFYKFDLYLAVRNLWFTLVNPRFGIFIQAIWGSVVDLDYFDFLCWSYHSTTYLLEIISKLKSKDYTIGFRRSFSIQENLHPLILSQNSQQNLPPTRIKDRVKSKFRGLNFLAKVTFLGCRRGIEE